AEKGPFPLYDPAKFLAAPMLQKLDPEVRRTIERHGIRNGLLTSIAPTGTISLLADNVSSGIEPVFAYRFTRNVRMPDGTVRPETVTDYAWKLYEEKHGANAAMP